ncbi:MAG: aldo/keto reductase [Lentisphaeria bacterium]|jgi:predicted aldo/keto reductase-like oxidoreductase|nr:aldo/keto reductase [Lentisphaeria bacterium]
MTANQPLPRRSLGRTGLRLSVLGLGGFHQVETLQDDLNAIVGGYLAAGGNYIETARSYGSGASEVKLGRALAGVPRDRYVLATKSSERTEEGAWRQLNESLAALGTDFVDLFFLHNLGDEASLAAVCAPQGAMRACERALDQGLIRQVAMSSHWPAMYLAALARLPLGAALIWGNYLDFCHYPEIPREILPALRERGVGILFMKPLADGYLYRSPERAFRFALAQPVDCVVAGFNSLDMLAVDVACCRDETAATPAEIGQILAEAPELGDYVCRQCAACAVLAGTDGEALKRIFELEGKVDRQMDDRRQTTAAQYALRERLKGWFGAAGRARAAYADLPLKAPELATRPSRPCRYGLDIARKLAIADAKLRGDEALRLL